MPDATPARQIDWLLYNADWVVTCDSRMSRFCSGAVAVEKDRIVAVGPSAVLRDAFRGRSEIDLGGCLLMPGLVNAHTHAAMSLFRGLADDLPLREWLFDVIFPMEAAFVTPDTVYLGTLLAALEMLKGGTTTFCDGYFFEESAARAAFESGIRAVLGQGILDFPAPDQPDPARFRQRAEAYLASFPTLTGRVRPSLFCHTPSTCAPETLAWVKGLCRENGLLFQTHLSETAGEAEQVEGRFGKRPVHYLMELGVLDNLSLCAHAIWLSEDEIRALAESGAAVANCPESNMKLASGVAPVPALVSAGARVGIGTDGCASNNDLDLFSEMDKAAKLHKVFCLDPLCSPAAQVLASATSGGASAIGLGEETGSLEPGKKADIIAIDLDRPHLVPLYEPVSHLVYSARRSDVKHVWIDGKRLVADGAPLSLNEPDVLAEAGKAGIMISRGLQGLRGNRPSSR